MQNDLISRSALLKQLQYRIPPTNYVFEIFDEAAKAARDIVENAPTVDAVVLSKEDAEFLANLRHELLTQPTDGNRDPRFWGVIEEVYEWGYDAESGQGWVIWDGENCCDVGEKDDLQSVLAELTDPDNYGYDPEEFVGCDEPEEVVERANDLGGGFTLSYYLVHHKVSEDHLFLTKKACQEYINKFGYNHNKPNTYVMTAERCPEYERLLKILKETEWRADDGK